MDRELDTWIDDVIDKQQYRNGIFSKKRFIDWLRQKAFSRK